MVRRSAKTRTAVRAKPPVDLVYTRIRTILREAQHGVARTVNSVMVRANWLVGREIVEEEQRGTSRAGYGEELIEKLSRRLHREFGEGFSPANLKYMRLFYLNYPALLSDEIRHAVRDESARANLPVPIRHAVRDESARSNLPVPIRHALRDESPAPGWLNSALSWTHYRLLTKVESPDARSFYEIEAAANRWSSRELERQINSLLFERLARSRDKKGLIRLARRGHEIQTASDVIKDPLVLEFLGIPSNHRMQESDLETALIDHLQYFLLELGKGFAFIKRQERITLDGDHFYIDLVFYHTVLKCYVLLDLKVDKLTHADIGQMQLYVNYFDEERRAPDDNPTIGLILCTDKNDAVVKYTLGRANRQIFASRYKLYLPSERELAREIRRELSEVRGNR